MCGFLCPGICTSLNLFCARVFLKWVICPMVNRYIREILLLFRFLYYCGRAGFRSESGAVPWWLEHFGHQRQLHRIHSLHGRLLSESPDSDADGVFPGGYVHRDPKFYLWFFDVRGTCRAGLSDSVSVINLRFSTP